MLQEILRICEAVKAQGGRALLVGGFVRDKMLGVDSKDLDIEVYGIPSEILRPLLEEIGPVNTVGERFTVHKLTVKISAGGEGSESARREIDVSLPRRETKSGRGHRGFVVEGDPWMAIEEAARRRDFTINAILFDPLKNEITDPFNGIADLNRRVLRAIAADTFIEDSLRVLRAMQLAARFEMTIEPETAALCRSIDLSDLPKERIWGEFEKLFTRAGRPSIGLHAALTLGILDKLFPEIRALVGCTQESDGLPEGDVFTHTAQCLDEAVKLVDDLPKEKRITVMLAVLCHDLGKPLTTRTVDGIIAWPGHDQAGEAPSISLMDRLGVRTLGGYDVRSQVAALVREHLRPRQFYEARGRITDGEFRRLAVRVDIDLLYRIAKADVLGSGTESSSDGPDWFIRRACELAVDRGAPSPLLYGRHLIDVGFEPGPRMGEVLREVYELQLDGKVTSTGEALAVASELFDFAEPAEATPPPRLNNPALKS